MTEAYRDYLLSEEIEEVVDYDGDPLVHDDLTCDKSMRHMHYWHNEHARIKRLGEKQIWEMQQRLQSKLQSIDNKIKYHEAACGNWFTKEGKKTWSGVFGDMRISKGHKKIKVEDLQTFLNWANKNSCPGLYRTTHDVNKTEAKAYIKETGEIPAGLDLDHGEETVAFILQKKDKNVPRETSTEREDQ